MDLLRSIHQWFLSFLSTLLSLFDRGRSIMATKSKMRDPLRINVKFEATKFVQLDVDRCESVRRLKEALSKKIDVPVNQIKLIFAGRELSNPISLQEYEMSQQSIIHAVRTLKPMVSMEIDEKIDENDDGVDVGEDDVMQNGETKRTIQMNFYVYCTKPCKGLEPAKLRVRCNECKMGTMIVSRDPCGWDDVLSPFKISGQCQMDSCQGKFAEFYFKCGSHPADENDTCPVLNLVRNNVNQISCLICTDIDEIVIVFTCAQSHVICISCFRMYGLSRLNERQFVQDANYGYTLPCPVGCEDSLIQETHHFHLLGEEQYDRYQRFGAEECLLQAGGVLCPVPGCGAGIIPDPECRKITCIQQGGQGCGFVFCRNCLQGFHLGECGESEISFQDRTVAFTVDASQAANSRWDRENKGLIKVITKPCPQCRTPTERDGGCMHMICTRPQCGFHWCWLCQSEWTRDCMANHWFD